MSFKHLAVLSLGATAVTACAPEDGENLAHDVLLTSSADSLSRTLGDADAVRPGRDGGQILAWIDDAGAAALVVEVDASGDVIDVSFTPTWLSTSDADLVTSADAASRETAEQSEEGEAAEKEAEVLCALYQNCQH